MRRGDTMSGNVGGVDGKGNGLEMDTEGEVETETVIPILRIHQIPTLRRRTKRRGRRRLRNGNVSGRRGNERGSGSTDWIRRRAGRRRLCGRESGISRRRLPWARLEAKRAQRVCMIIDCLIRTADSTP